MHSNCTRVRVAIDVPCPPEPILNMDPELHIGHARTLLVGSLIAEELGLPFHVRLDGAHNGAFSHDVQILAPLCVIISRLGIKCDHVYWQPQEMPKGITFSKHFGDRAAEMERFLSVAADYNMNRIGVVVDDLMNHYPSLVVRGAEFVDPSMSVGTQANGANTTMRYAAHQALMSDMMEREWHEINLPLITMRDDKVSKSLSPILLWSFFQRFPGAWLRAFLLATVMDPTAPLKALKRKFSIDAISTQHYEWDWAVWDQYIRDCEA